MRGHPNSVAELGDISPSTAQSAVDRRAFPSGKVSVLAQIPLITGRVASPADPHPAAQRRGAPRCRVAAPGRTAPHRNRRRHTSRGTACLHLRPLCERAPSSSAPPPRSRPAPTPFSAHSQLPGPAPPIAASASAPPRRTRFPPRAPPSSFWPSPPASRSIPSERRGPGAAHTALCARGSRVVYTNERI
ncbi:hypothetical protein B0H17DRAFT_1217802 [Mycena rosella]|uniref:Uncharacterized protein n=1 Tax=Mycena rosella TaxID=1033263 RepID=A0AAD7BV47_MYCRO|nr:hypothetical protein B0H17DRAFT_1217802 [Mycena rosella]